MTTKGYVNDFYKQFEKLNNNLETATNTISRMSLELSLTKEEIDLLKNRRTAKTQGYNSNKWKNWKNDKK